MAIFADQGSFALLPNSLVEEIANIADLIDSQTSAEDVKRCSAENYSVMPARLFRGQSKPYESSNPIGGFSWDFYEPGCGIIAVSSGKRGVRTRCT
jgi:hypothetical protein